MSTHTNAHTGMHISFLAGSGRLSCGELISELKGSINRDHCSGVFANVDVGERERGKGRNTHIYSALNCGPSITWE